MPVETLADPVHRSETGRPSPSFRMWHAPAQSTYLPFW
ncbi:hypothetical protein NJ7G_0844 [Natrinema sp. J7-2]|nr:hypothetical protein NJ7G_0844 [Natrinema sp. J7-2]